MANQFSPEKTVGTSIQSWKTLATANIDISSSIDVTSKWSIGFAWTVGRQNGTAYTANWPSLRIQASRVSGGGAPWLDLIQLVVPVGASVGNTTLNGALTAGGTTALLTAVTNFVVGDLVFLGDTSAANYEIVRIKSISGSTLTFEEAYANNHSNAATVTSQASQFYPIIDVTAYKAIRSVVTNANSGQTVAYELYYNTFDDFMVN